MSMTRPCGCEACTGLRTANAKARGVEYGIFSDPMMRMFLCETCGNKRCPHATNHVLACTGSNAPGQKGSSYEDALHGSPTDGLTPPDAQYDLIAPYPTARPRLVLKATAEDESRIERMTRAALEFRWAGFASRGMTPASWDELDPETKAREMAAMRIAIEVGRE